MRKLLSAFILTIFVSSILTGSFNAFAKSKSYVKGINLSSTDISMYLNDSKTIKATVDVVGNADKKLVASSSSKNIAAVTSKIDKSGVSSITVKGKKIGKAIITVRSCGKTSANKYCTKKINVTIRKKPAAPSSLVIDNTNPRILYSGEQIKLTATAFPSDAINKSITWKSSNPYIASVDKNGLVTAKTAGTANVTAYTANKKVYATSVIRVNQLTSYINSGTYTMRFKNSNFYLDHQGGIVHNTNVHVWDGDGYSNNNQKLNIERADDNRYLLWSFCAPSLMIDVNRGDAYSNPITTGLNIDLWENNDWQAQEWLFTKTYDGYYIARLNYFRDGAIETQDYGNGCNIVFNPYNPENDRQKVELINLNDTSKDSWICNTPSTGKVEVLCGASNSYFPIGYFTNDQKITVLGDKVGEWYKVKGNSKVNGREIIGYIHSMYITATKPPVKKSTQKITAKSFNKIYGDKPFKLNANAMTKLSYKTSNERVATVSSDGKVTIKGLGKTTITITAATSSKYKSATKKITVRVMLKPVDKKYIKTKKAGKNSLKVYWKKVSKISGYQINVKTKVKGNSINNGRKQSSTSVLLKNASKGQKIEFSIRTYKKIGKTYYYSQWTTKNIVVK